MARLRFAPGYAPIGIVLRARNVNAAFSELY